MLFDLDGTLVDSTNLHAVTWWQALRAAGHDASLATIHRAVGAGSGEVVRQALGPGHGAEADDIAADQKALYSAWWPSLRPLAGARDLVRRCHDDGLVVVLASSAPEREMKVVRRLLDVDDALDLVTTADDAEHSKPDPDIVGVALQRAGLTADHAVFVGDAVRDVQAATKAGIPCVGVTCGGTSGAELRDAGAILTFDGPAELLSNYAALRDIVDNGNRRTG